MFSDDRFLIMAKAQHQYLLSEAEWERLARMTLAGNPSEKSVYERAAKWIFGWEKQALFRLRFLTDRQRQKGSASTTQWINRKPECFYIDCKP